MEKAEQITVEVAFADEQRQLIIALSVSPDTTAYQAVLASGICQEFPQIDPDSAPMGIFSKPLNGKGRPSPRDYVLRPGDRVEIYRPLLIDPKQARRARVEKTRKPKR